MVAFVSGNSLGLFNTSLGVLGGAGSVGDATTGRAGEGVDVNVATGNLIISHRDEYLTGLGLDLPILRTYNSQGLLNDDNGDNWRLGFSRTVSNLTGTTVNTTGSTVTRTGEDGAAIVYTYDAATGKYVSDAGAGARDSLTYDSTTSGWTWTDGDSQTTERYGSIANGGQLQSVTDRNGNTVTLSWNGNLLTSITDAGGERVDFVYDTTPGKTNNLIQVNTVTRANATDATATLTQTRVYYHYDDSNRLDSVKIDLTPADGSVADGNVYTTSYTYDASGRIASVTQTDGSQLQFVYDGSGRIMQVKDVRSVTDIRVTLLDYSVPGQTTITDTLGNATVMAYDGNGQLTRLTRPGIGDTFYQYDAKGNVTQITDPKGNVTVYGYDSQDNRIYQRDAAGNVVERRYGGGNQLLAETRYLIPDPDGAGSQLAGQPLTTRYVYDAVGNLRFAISPEGRVTEYRYDAYGRQVSQVAYTGGTFDVNAAQLFGLQDFSVDASGLSLPATTGYFNVANGVLNVTSQNGASTNTYTATGAFQPLGTTFSAEITTDASSQRALVIGAQNGASGTASRRLNAYFSGSALYANFINADGSTANVQLLATVKNNTTYMVEVETTASGATLYVYEKGQTRASGVQYQNTVAGWTQARWQITAVSDPSITAASTLKVDNLRLLGQNWSQDFTTPTAELFPDANAIALGSFTQSNGTLTVTQTNNATTVYPTTTGAAFTLPTLLKGEISFTAADANRYLVFGLANAVAGGNSTYRRHAVELSNGNWNASSWDPVKSSYSTRTLGQAKPGVTYVVEVEVDAQGSTLYVYEKGKERSSGFVDRQAQTNWSNAKLIIGSRSSSAITANIDTAVDNLSISRLPSEMGLMDWAVRQNLAATQRVDTAYDFRGGVQLVSRYAKVGADGVGVRDGSQSDTYFVYDAWGQLLNTIDPRGTATTSVNNDYVTTYTYDGMGRMLTRSQSDANGVSLTLSSAVFNDAQRQNTVTLVNNLLTITTYDQGGHAVSVMQMDGNTGAAMARTDYVLDKLGRTVAKRITTNAGSLLSSYAIYDAAGRKVADIDATGAMTEYVYNADSQLIKTTAYFTLVPSALLSGDPTAFTLNALRPATTTSDRTARSLYDAAGRLAKTIDAEGAVTEFQYDGAGRLIATKQYSERLSSAQMTALAAISGEVALTNSNTIAASDSANDRTTRQFYSDDGLLLGTLDAEGYLTEYRYDGAGQRVQSIQYAGATKISLRATATSVDQLRPNNNVGDITATTLYNDAGQMTGQIDGEGYLTEMQYDAAGNVSKTIRYARKVTTSSVVGATVESLRPAADPAIANRQTINQYDAYNRLVQTQSLPDNLTTTYQYDNAGNLVNVTASSATNQRQGLKRYDVLGRVTAELSGENAAKITAGMTQTQIEGVWTDYGTRYAYDASGVVTSITQGMGPGQTSRKTLYYYDGDGRNTYTINGAGEVSLNVYDAFGGKTQEWRAKARLSTAQLATLTGGMQNAALNTAINAISGAGLIETYNVNYTLRGQIAAIFDAFGRKTQELVYTAFGDLLARGTLVDPARSMRVDTFTHDRRGLQVMEYDDVATTNAITQTVYDAFGRMTQSTGPTGVIANQGYDRLGRVVTTSIGGPGTSATIADRTIAYDAFGRTLTVTSVDGATTYAYDDANRKVTITTPGGISTSSTRNEFGETVTVTDGRTNSTTYQYNRDGQVIKVTDPAGNTRTDYDAVGEVIQTTDKNGVVTQYTYDAAGRMLTTTLDSSGLNITTATRYDALGEAIWSQDANGVWTRTDYDDNGRVTTVEVDPVRSPNWLSGANDNPNGLAIKTTYTYDAAGDVLTVTEAAGSTAAQTTVYEYDNFGRRTKETVDPTGLAIATRYVYADAGNLVQKIDGNAHSTYYGYDIYGRQTVVLNADNAVTYTLYDTENRVKEVRQYKDRVIGTPGATGTDGVRTDASLLALLPGGAASTNYASTKYLYDVDGRQTYKVDAEGGVTKTEYDNAGNIVKTTRYATAVAVSAGGSTATLTSALSTAANAARDRVTQYVYDGANRLTWMVDAEGGVTKNEYDSAGNVVRTTAYASPYAGTVTAAALQSAYSAANASNRVTRYAYDAAGRNIATVNAAGAVIRTQYDNAGNAVSTTAYNNVISSTNLNTLPLVMAWSDISGKLTASAANDRVTQRVFDNAGRMRYEIDALKYVTENTYDALGRVATTTRYANPIGVGTGQLSGAGNVIDPVNDQTDKFYYDKAGRLDHSTDALGKTEYYTYDGLGNKKTFVNKKGDTWTYQYDNLGRLTKEISPQVTVTGTTDSAGNAVVDAASSGNARIVTIVTYDAMGNALSRTEGAELVSDGTLIQSRTTSYTYDLVGRQVKTTFPPVSVYNSAGDSLVDGSAARSEATPVALYSQVTYDALGNALANIDVAGNVSVKAYDRLGQVVYDMDALGYVTYHQRNAFGEVTQLIRFANATNLAPSALPSASAVPTVANINAAVNAAGIDHGYDRSITTAYDAMGRATLVTEPQTYAYDPGTDTQPAIYVIAGKKTQTTYDAFGNAIKTEVSKADGTWLATRQYFDKLDRQTATVDALNYLTEKKYDAAGNVIETNEYANAATSVSDTSYTKGSASTTDRKVTYAFDVLNRKTSETRWNVEYNNDAAGNTPIVGNLTTGYAYDVLGNQISATDAAGNTTYTYYDVIGHITAVVSPARVITQVNGGVVTNLLAAPVSVFKLDAYGNVVVKIDYANGATGVTTAGYSLTADAANDRTTTTQYDKLGHAIEVTDPTTKTTYTSYDKAGHVAKQWHLVTDASENGGAAHTQFTIYQYDKLGRQTAVIMPASNTSLQNGTIGVVSQATAGMTTTQMQYNAFGEMTRKGVNGWQEFYDYDNAGRLWRSNSGDGNTKVMLYDLQGNATAQITSAGSGFGNLDLSGSSYTDASQVAILTSGVRRTDYYYDALGRVTKQVQPERQQGNGGVTLRKKYLTFSVNSYGTLANDGISPSYFQNVANLTWTPLDGLGSGNVKVVVTYILGNGATQTATQVFTNDLSASGANMSWRSGENLNYATFTGIQVFKADRNGAFQLVYDQNQGANTGNVIDVATPATLTTGGADAGAVVQLQYRKTGTTGWTNAQPLTDFGDATRFDASNLPQADYDYQVVTTRNGVQSTTASGTLTVASTPLATIDNSSITMGLNGLYTWPSPGTAVTQVFNYRLVGATAWSSLSVTAQGNGRDGVDIHTLPAGTYQYELLWTHTGDPQSYAHATGTVTVSPPSSSGIVVGADANGATLTWTTTGQPGTASMQYRLAGTTTWNTIAATTVVHESPGSQTTGGGAAGVSTTYSISLSTLAQGAYETRILRTPYQSTVTTTVTGNLSVTATTAGYYTTQTTTTWVQDTAANASANLSTQPQTITSTTQVLVPATNSTASPTWSSQQQSVTSTTQVWVPGTNSTASANLSTQPLTTTSSTQVWVPGTNSTASPTWSAQQQTVTSSTQVWVPGTNSTASPTWSTQQQTTTSSTQVWVPATNSTATPTWSTQQQTIPTSTQVWVPATSASASVAWTTNTNGVVLNTSNSTLTWSGPLSSASAMKYRVAGSGSAWTTVAGTVIEFGMTATSGPKGSNATVSYASLPSGQSYEIQLTYTSGGGVVSTAATGTLTLTAAVAGHYVTQTGTATVPLTSTVITDNATQTLHWDQQGPAGTGQLRYKLSGASTWSTIAATTVYRPAATGPGYTTYTVSFASLPAGTYTVEIDYTASGAANFSAVTAGTMTVAAGVAGHYVTQTTTTTFPLTSTVITDNAAQTLHWDQQGVPGTGQLRYKLSGASTWSTIAATAVNHPAATGPGYTTYTVSFASLPAGTYTVEIDYTASGASSFSAVTAGTMTVTAGTAGYYQTQTTTTTLPLTSTVITDNAAQTLHWDQQGVPGTGQLRYKLSGASTWSTIAATAVNHPAATGPGYTTYTVSFASLPAGTYTVEIDYTASGASSFSAVTAGTMTITAGVAGHYVTQTTTTTTPVISGIGVNNPAQTLMWDQGGTGGSAQLRYRLSGTTGTWNTVAATGVNHTAGTTTFSVSFASLAAGTYDIEVDYFAQGASSPTAATVGTLTVTAGTAGYYQTQTTTSVLPLTYAVITDNAAQTLHWDQQGAAGTAQMRYRVSGTSTWSTIAATTFFHEPSPTGGGGAFTTYTVSFASLAPGNYDVEMDYTAAGASSFSAVTTGTMTVAAGVAAHYVTQTSTSTLPLISGVGVNTSTQALMWDQGGTGGSARMLYRLSGTTGAWNTVSGTGVNHVAGMTTFSVSYAGLASGTYDIELDYLAQGASTPTAATVGTLTVTAATGHTVTQTNQVWVAPVAQSAVFVDTTTLPFFATPNADAGPTAVSLTGPTPTLTQHLLTSGVSTSARPTIDQKLDRWGNVVQISDARMSTWVTKYTYNANNQMTSQTSPDGNGLQTAKSPVIRWYYDKLGRQVAMRDANGNVNGEQYDGDGNLTTELHADTGSITHQYDAFGEEVRQVDAMNNVTTYTYDKLGNRKGIVHDQVNVYTISNTNVLSNPVFQSVTELMDYDEAGRLIRQTNSVNGEKVVYRYDLLGNITATTKQGSTTWDTYNAQNRKTAERDANGNVATWGYDYFGHINAHTDLGGAVFKYTYDKAFNLTRQQTTSPGERVANQDLAYTYDGAGQAIKIVDSAVGETTVYAYDLAGNHVQEKVTKGTMVYQDNHLAYDTLNRLRDISNDKAHIVINYDANGNRTHINTHVLNNTGGNQDTDRWYQYDAMNRQTLVDGVSGDGGLTFSINASQGHKITYDKNGNRKTDTRVTNKVGYAPPHQGAGGTSEPASFYLLGQAEVTETYSYDKMDRLMQTSRDDGNGSTIIDNRYYDAASRNLYSGAVLNDQYAQAMNKNLGSSSDITVNRYDVNGRMIHQSVLNSGGAARYDVDYTSIDAVGNVKSYKVHSYEGSGYDATYTTTYKRFDGYSQDAVSGNGYVSISGSNTAMVPDTTTSSYDANGFLIGVSDKTDPSKGRTFVNDAQGHALWISRAQGVEQQLVVNGEVLGRYGMGVDPLHANTDGSPIYIDRADFNFGYQSVRTASAGGPSVYTVAGGDTLAGIAQSFYGDSSLWYVIADANGLTSDADIQPGQTLTIPSRAAGLHNTSGTYQPYNAGQVVGDTTPHLTVQPPPPPQVDDGCGILGQIIVIVVAAVVTYFTAGALTSSLGPILAGAIGGAAGSVASQAVGIAIGAQDGFSWKGVAMGAISGAVGGALKGVNIGTGSAIGDAMIKGAISNTMTQGIGIITGLQDSFSWRSVAASAAGAGINEAINENLLGAADSNGVRSMKTDFVTEMGSKGAAKFTADVMSGMASGVVSSVIRAGKVDMVSVAADAFGNAIANSIIEKIETSKLEEKMRKEQFSLIPKGMTMNFRTGQLVPNQQTRMMQTFDRVWQEQENAASSDDVQNDSVSDSVDSGQKPRLRDLVYRPGEDDPVARKVAQEAGHYYLPALIGVAFLGAENSKTFDIFNARRLDNILTYSQYPDETRLLDGFTNGVRYKGASWAHPIDGPSDDAQIGLVYEQSIHALNGHTVRENIEFYQKLIADNPGNDAVIGMAMHGLVDSIYHSDRGDNPNPTFDELMEMRTYTAPIGHGMKGSDPDFPSETITAHATTVLLDAFKTITGVSSVDDTIPGQLKSISDAAWSNERQVMAGSIDGKGETTEENFRNVAPFFLPPGLARLRPEGHNLPNPLGWSTNPFSNPITMQSTYDETDSYLRRSMWNTNTSKFLSDGIDAAILIANRYIETYGSTTPALSRNRFGLSQGTTAIPQPVKNAGGKGI